MTSPFTYKGYGRIYVKTKDDIKRAENLFKKLDKFEFDYYPDGLVTTLDYYPNVIYVGRYDSRNLKRTKRNHSLQQTHQRKNIYS